MGWGRKGIFVASILLVLFFVAVDFSFSAPIITGIRQLEAGEAPRFDIKTDQPVTYEAYKMPQVLRYVIDLQNVEPGMVSNLTKLDTPSVKRILLQQKNLNGLMLTRVIFDLSREMDGRVVADEGGRRLLVVFTPPLSKSPMLSPQSPAAYSSTPLPTPSATLANKLPPLRKKSLGPVVPEKTDLPLQKEMIAAVKDVDAPATIPANSNGTVTQSDINLTPKVSPQINAVKVEVDGIMMEISGDCSVYKTFILKNPARLVIDLPGGNSIIDKPVVINRFGVRTLRVGKTPGQVRMVLDTAGNLLMGYEVRRVSNGLKVLFKGKK